MTDSGVSAGGVRPVGSDATTRTLHPARVVGLARESAWALTVWIAMVSWAIVLILVARDRHAEFRYARLDLGNMVQAVWNTAHGRLLENTNGYTGEQTSRLGSHVDPILAALAPLWIVVPSPLTLEAVQIVSAALGALPVLWLGRRHLGSERAAGLVSLAYLAYPWIAWTAVDSFHPVTLAIPLLLYGTWFLDTDRLLPFGICAVGVALTGELMGIAIAALGLWFALARGRRVAGGAIAVAGVTWTFFALYVVVPAYSGDESRYFGAFEDVGGSPWGIVRSAVTDSGTVLREMSESRDLVYLLLLALPLAGAFVLAPALAALAVPQLAVNLLAGVEGTTNPREHYGAAILPFLFAAIAIGLGRMSPTHRVRGAVLVLTLSLAATIAVGPWPGTILGAANWGPLPSSPDHVRVLERAVALVPEDAPVSTTNRVGSHVGARRYLYSVPTLGRAEWIILETADTSVPTAISVESDPEALRAFQERIERSPEWRKVLEESGVIVFRKVTP